MSNEFGVIIPAKTASDSFLGAKCRYVNLPGITGVVGFHVLLDPDKTQYLSPNSQTSHLRPNLGSS